MAPRPSALLPMLAAQAFAGGKLVRGLGSRALRDVAALPDTRFLLVAERRVCVQRSSRELALLDAAALRCLGLTIAADGEHLEYPKTLNHPKTALAAEGEQLGHPAASAPSPPSPLYYLGALPADSKEKFLLAADMSSHDGGGGGGGGSGNFVASLAQRGLAFQDLRSVMLSLSPSDLSVAGHAVALSQWHQTHRFCPRCGAPARPVAGGAKRQCSGDESHKLYPRTDPVVIMLVESPDGSQGESIEEAVAREVREEAGVAVASVSIVGSQPWPLGRGGSHELMVGCVARATSEDLAVDASEMEECRWVGRAELLQALENSASAASPYANPARRGGAGGDGGGEEPLPPPGFYVPPPIAIAYFLIKQWVEASADRKASLTQCSM